MKKMKKKYFLILVLFAVCCIFLCAFTFDVDSSVKSLTHPYINTYECTAAQLGNEDLLEKYDYFIITFLNEKELEVAFKSKYGKRHAYVCDYEFDEENRRLSAEIGILGFKFRQSTIIEDGKFTVSMPILGKPLIMNFAVK